MNASEPSDLDSVSRVVAACIGRALQIEDRARSFRAETRLLGEIAEFDSMAILTVITALEEEFGFIVDDDEISADTFATIGSLASFVGKKVSHV